MTLRGTLFRAAARKLEEEMDSRPEESGDGTKNVTVTTDIESEAGSEQEVLLNGEEPVTVSDERVNVAPVAVGAAVVGVF